MSSPVSPNPAPEPSFLKRADQPNLAYIYTPPHTNNTDPIVMFCGGYRSDMFGSKAQYLEDQCKNRGQGYLRFDYSGHGISEGEFNDGTIGQWANDAIAILDHISKNKSVILVGSSMGGWMALLIARARPQNIRGLIGIAAAPDFTEDLFARLEKQQQDEMMENGFVKVPNDYSDEPYHYSREFYLEAKQHLLLSKQYTHNFPIRLIQGKQDQDVPWQTTQKIEKSYGGDIQTILIDDGDHRLSRPQDLPIIDHEIVSINAK